MSTLFSLFFFLYRKVVAFLSCISQLYMLHAVVTSVLYLGAPYFHGPLFQRGLVHLFSFSTLQSVSRREVSVLQLP